MRSDEVVVEADDDSKAWLVKRLDFDNEEPDNEEPDNAEFHPEDCDKEANVEDGETSEVLSSLAELSISWSRFQIPGWTRSSGFGAAVG